MGKVKGQEFKWWSSCACSQEADMNTDDNPSLWNGATRSYSGTSYLICLV